MEQKNNFKLEIYESVDSYVGKIVLPSKIVDENTIFTNLYNIIILDRSGSMGSSLFKIVNHVFPKLFQKLGYKDNEPEITLITFESKVEVFHSTPKEIGKMNIKPQGQTFMQPALWELQTTIKNILKKNKNATFRVLAISDGELHDQENTVEAAEGVKEIVLENNLKVNAHSIRFFTSSDEPDTRGLSSVMQFNSITTPSLLDLTNSMDDNEISDVIADLFKYDGFNSQITIETTNGESCFKFEPWLKEEKNIPLSLGENTFWISKEIIEKFKKENIQNGFILNISNKKKESIEVCFKEAIGIGNYQKIIEKKIEYYLQKMKILKILNTKESLDEMNKILEYFTNFDKLLTYKENPNFSTKISSRVLYIKSLINKRAHSLINVMNAIKNDELIAQLNSRQQADYLRSIDTNDRTAKGLAKRAVNEGIDFDDVAKGEVIEMSKHIDELKDVDDSNDTISFYSTCTTLDGLRTLCKMPTDEKEIFDSLTASDILKLMNIVGIACYSPHGNYPDPMTYRLTKIYVGTFVSVSDIITALEVGNGQLLTEIGNPNNEINNVIPYFDNELIHQFLLKYAPRLLEYTASIGMRRMIAEVPYTWEYTYLSGIWKMIEILQKDKSEINIKVFVNLLNSYKNASGSHFDYVLDLLKDQQEYDKDGMSIYIANNGITNMTKPLLTLVHNCKTLQDNNMIKRIIRATYQFEIYQYVRKMIRKQPSEEIESFIYQYLEDLLGIDYQKHPTPLPKMFEANLNPVFHEDFEVNNDKLNGLYKEIWWADFIAVVPKFYKAALSNNPVNEFKQLPNEDIDDKVLAESLGIDYDIKLFKLFCVVQSFLQKEKADRSDTKLRKMKILDLVFYDKALKMVKNYVKGVYAGYYQIEKQKQTKQEQKLISEKLVSLLLESKTKEDFKKLLNNGLKMGVITFVLTDNCSLGYNNLIGALCTKEVDVPLRFYKLLCIATGKDDENNVVWNKGNSVRDKSFLKKLNDCLSKDEIEQIRTKLMKMSLHIYRELPNRQGHSNEKPSYWALGYMTLDLMFSEFTDEEIDEYKKLHSTCCGINHLNSSFFKKIKRKEKKKIYKDNVNEYYDVYKP